MLNKRIYNCHTHIFTIDHVPDKFLPPVLKSLAKKIVSRKFVRVLRKVGFRDWSELLKRYYFFMKIGEKGSQENIFKHLQGFYPSETAFVALSMDMEFMGAGKVPENFDAQLLELELLKKKHSDHIYPFVFAHPERQGIFDIVRHSIEERGFAGIKIYPALGYFPHDPRLEKVYEYAEQNSIPIMTHCTRGGVFYKGKLSKERRTEPRTGEVYPKAKNSIFTDVYSNPERYCQLLKDFPKLKLCFAHWGGANEWDKFLMNSWHDEAKDAWFYKIIQIINQYENVYTDISYTLADPKYYATLKSFLISNEKLRKRVLFGTDYYMTEQEVSERAFGMNLRGFIGEEIWNGISHDNPKSYLNL